MPASKKTAICTWFVADTPSNATFFPQIGAASGTPEAQAVYLRCVACFFASSVALNPGRHHLFFTNSPLPVIDGLSLVDAFARWGVETVQLPISFRLPQGAVNSWGNQFYILDILRWFAQYGGADRLIVLDSDCLWIHPADSIEQAIDRDGVLTYTLGEDEHAAEEAINGLSRAGMARFARGFGGPEKDRIEYQGGEIFAATLADVRRVNALVPQLWTATLAGGADAPREEAHFLSVIYALNSYRDGTANPFIRRIWTTLRRHNAREADRALTIWHLPAAKLFGFKALFERLAASPDQLDDPRRLGFDEATYRALMGVPRASLGLKLEMLVYKLIDRAARLRVSARRGARREDAKKAL